MKRITLSMIILLIAGFVMQSFYSLNKRKPQTQTYAVIVGVSNYKDRSITSLKYADKDAQSYANFLRSPNAGAIPAENMAVLINENATRSAVIKALRSMFDRATEDDVIIFFFSGHGIPDPKIPTDMYFATYDTDGENCSGTALENGDVTKEFYNSKAKLKLFLADACHSGNSGIYTGIKDDGLVASKINQLVANMNSQGAVTLTACEKSEGSQEDIKWGQGHGVFTYEMIKGLNGEADQINPQSPGYNDGVITARELYEYLDNIVPKETANQQHPTITGDGKDFPLSVYKKVARPVQKDPQKKAQTANTLAQTANIFIEQYNQKNPKSKLPEIPVKQNTATKTASQTGPVTQNDDPAMPGDMLRGECIVGGRAYAKCTIVNNYGEDILLCGYTGCGRDMLDMMLAAGQTVTTANILVSGYNNRNFDREFCETKLYFRTLDETKAVKYGTMIVSLAPCKIKSIELNKKNIYMSTTGEHMCR